ncbi:zinc finger domain-containing protein [Prauserella flavalba]|uniref:zinc finger domain-containing protein n=1 Tax=Prauserella flavalba TaxID=1477506 RepID=UPI0036E832FE
MSRYTQRELRQIDEFANFWMTREDAETERCEHCAAEPGQTCRDPDTDEPVRYPAHWIRIKTSEQRKDQT